MLPSPSISRSTPAANTAGKVIVLDHVSCLFGSFVALRDVSLSLPEGASVMVLGENGAGKSTLLRLLAGLLPAQYGTAKLFGEAPGTSPARVAYMSHASMLYDELTAPENLEYFARLNSSEADPSQALREVGLDPANPRRLAEYSQGMRQRASLARVLLASPDLLLLDEPFSSLDISSAQSMVQRLVAYTAQPTAEGGARTLLLTTHQPELAAPLAQTTLILKAGKLIWGPQA